MKQAVSNNLEKEIRSLIAEILEVEESKITSNARFMEELGMDSMMALEILASIEKKYKIRVPEDKITRLRNLDEAIKMTKEYLGK